MGLRESYFVCTSRYTADAKAFAFGKPLRLIDGTEFVRRINLLPLHQRIPLLETAFAGDYDIPSCPKCGDKMVINSGAKGKFWGCLKYPKCRATPIPVRKNQLNRSTTSPKVSTPPAMPISVDPMPQEHSTTPNSAPVVSNVGAARDALDELVRKRRDEKSSVR